MAGFRHTLFALFALALFAVPARAQTVEAFAAAETAFDAAWAAAPLHFRRTLFVTDATSYGTYVAATDSSFWLSEPLLIYAEPIGYGYAPAAGGGFRFGLAFDLVVRDDRGNVVYEQADMARAQMTSTSRNRELMVKLTLSLSSGTPGAYTLEFTARDLAGAKTANFSLPFTLTE